MHELLQTPDGKPHTLFGDDHLVELVRGYLGDAAADRVQALSDRADRNAEACNRLSDGLDALEGIVRQLADEPDETEQRRLAQKAYLLFRKAEEGMESTDI